MSPHWYEASTMFGPRPQLLPSWIFIWHTTTLTPEAHEQKAKKDREKTKIDSRESSFGTSHSHLQSKYIRSLNYQMKIHNPKTLIIVFVKIYPLSEQPPLIVYSTCSLACKAPGLPVQSFACVVLSSPSQPSSLSSSSMSIPHHCHHLGTSSVFHTRLHMHKLLVCLCATSSRAIGHHHFKHVTSIFRRWLPSSGLQIALF